MVEVPEHAVKENEVLVQVHSASINQLDVKLKSGEFKLLLPYKFPLILGHNVAGTITEVGSKVSRFKIGDEIFARPTDFKIGTFAEYIAVDENDVALKPKNIIMKQAASFPLVALTVWQAFVKKQNFKKDRKCLFKQVRAVLEQLLFSWRNIWVQLSPLQQVQAILSWLKVWVLML